MNDYSGVLGFAFYFIVAESSEGSTALRIHYFLLLLGSVIGGYILLPSFISLSIDVFSTVTLYSATAKVGTTG